LLESKKSTTDMLLRDTPAWKDGIKKRNVEDLSKMMEEDFDISSGEQEDVKKALEKKDPVFIK